MFSQGFTLHLIGAAGPKPLISKENKGGKPHPTLAITRKTMARTVAAAAAEPGQAVAPPAPRFLA